MAMKPVATISIFLIACAAPTEHEPSSGSGATHADPIGMQLGALTDAPRTIPYAGYVDFDGEPVNAGGVKFNFVLFPCATPGPGQCSHLWVARGTWNDGVAWPQGWPTAADASVSLPIFSGRFTVELGGAGQDPLPDVIYQGQHETLYLGIRIEGSGLGALQKVVPAFRSVASTQADRFHVRSAIEIDDPTAGGAVALEADGGLVVSHTNDTLAVDASLLRVEHGGATQLGVTAGGGVSVGGDLNVGGAIDVAGDVRAAGQVCDANGCSETRKVAWHAYNSAGTRFGSGQTMAYASTTVNVGNAYNASNGIATIPVTGVYRLCTYSITAGQGALHMQLFVNGASVNAQGGVVYAYDGPGTGHVAAAGCALRALNTLDTVEWRSMGIGVYGSGLHSYMNGELL